MSEKSIRISEDTINLLKNIKDKYSLNTYDICINSLALFILKNDINPKDDFVGDFRTELISMEKRLLQAMDIAHKKITKDNATLRGWVGGVTKDHLVPITKKIEKIYDLEISKKSSENIDNHKIENPLNSHIEIAKQEEIRTEINKDEINECEEKKREYYSKYQNTKQALFKIFNNSKIEQGGMLSPQKIVINLSLEEWEEMKNKM